MGVRNVIIQVTYFLNGPMFNLFFLLPYSIILRETDFFLDLTLEVQIIWKLLAFQCYRQKYRNAEKYLNFQKFQLK